MGDFSTMIGIREFTTRERAIRLPASDLGPYHAFVVRSHHAFQRDPSRYTLHFHLQQNTSCVGEEEVLNPAVWDQGRYFVGGKIEFFAHFVDMGLQRAPGGGIGLSEERSLRSQSGMMGPPAVPSRGSTPGLPILSPIPPPLYPPLPPMGYNLYSYGHMPPPPLPGLPPVGPTPIGDRPAPPSIRQPPRTRRNNNSTTTYTLCMPIPASRYNNRAYYSAPFIFIPVPPGPPRPRTHAQRYAEPFPGFQFPENAAGLGEDGMRDGSRSSSTEYEFDAGAEMSPVRQEEEERSASQPHEERVFLPQESPVRQEERGGSQDEEGLFVPEGGGVDMAAALAWEEDEEDGGDRV